MVRKISLHSGVCFRTVIYFCMYLCIPVLCAAQPIFWETEIIQALDSRDNCYRNAGIDSATFFSMRSDAHHISIDTSSINFTSPWPLFLYGLTSASDTSGASKWFAMSIAATEKDPGGLWVLSQEFERCEQPFWQEICLKKLEIQFLLSGAQSAPIICQPLLHKAVLLANNHSHMSANKISTNWIAVFDRYPIWPAIISAKAILLTNSSAAFSLLSSCCVKIAHSWELQLSLVRQAYKWLFYAILAFIIGIVFALGLKYLPMALHPFSELLPPTFRLKTKQNLCIGFFVSLIMIGIIPFLWIFFFCIWPHARGRDKILASICLVFVMLYPLHLKCADMFDACFLSDNSVQLFKKAIDEGYYPALDSALAARTQAAPADYLAHTAYAICLQKHQDLAGAHPHIQVALRFAQHDPVVMTTAGNTLFLTGDLSGAKNIFMQCIKQYPDFVPAYFNLGQYYLASMETSKALEYINQATNLNSSMVNSFVKTNDDCFSKEWPLSRQLMQPDYTPNYFWSVIFPANNGSWQSVNIRFGAAFFGLSVTLYMVLSIVLFILLLCTDFAGRSNASVKKIFICKLCQAPICRKCKRGGICQDCFNATQHIRNESIRQRIMAKVQFKSHRFHTVSALFFDLCFPGAGMVFKREPLYKSIPLLILSACVYGTYIYLYNASFTYPGWLSHTIMQPILYACISYNIIFIIRTVILTVKNWKLPGE